MWHDRYIGPSHRPLVTASSISILTGFLEMKDYWTVMPVTTARGLMKHAPIRILALDPAPPKRDPLSPDPPVAHHSVGPEYGAVLRISERIPGQIVKFTAI